MKILIHNNLLKELTNLSNKDLQSKIYRYLRNFESYFTSPLKYETSKIQKITIRKSNLYVFRIDHNYRLIFTAEYDKENELNVALLEMAKHEDYERKVFKLIDE